LEHLDYFPIGNGRIILPTDELTPSFFRGVAKNHQAVFDDFPIQFDDFPSYKAPFFTSIYTYLYIFVG
jgi:hypothetical protein